MNINNTKEFILESASQFPIISLIGLTALVVTPLVLYFYNYSPSVESTTLLTEVVQKEEFKVMLSALTKKIHALEKALTWSGDESQLSTFLDLETRLRGVSKLNVFLKKQVENLNSSSDELKIQLEQLQAAVERLNTDIVLNFPPQPEFIGTESHSWFFERINQLFQVGVNFLDSMLLSLKYFLELHPFYSPIGFVGFCIFAIAAEIIVTYFTDLFKGLFLKQEIFNKFFVNLLKLFKI